MVERSVKIPRRLDIDEEWRFNQVEYLFVGNKLAHHIAAWTCRQDNEDIFIGKRIQAK